MCLTLNVLRTIGHMRQALIGELVNYQHVNQLM
jgi:hypothetical protein